MNNLRLAMAFASALLCWCTGSLTSVASGGSSQQGNGVIVGTAFAVNGVPAAEATVHVRPHNYVETLIPENIPGKIFDTQTDKNGKFTIKGVEPDSYTVEINDQEFSAVAVNATVGPPGTPLDLGSLALKPYAEIAGTVDTTGQRGRRFFVQVFGLERLIPVSADGRFSSADLPEGTYNLQLQPFDSTVPPQVIGIHALSGATTPVAIVLLPGWRYSRRLFLNTTASGAGVAGNVYDFPVLVRLTKDNFDFSQVASRGADLRFAKANGAPQPYEIENWDSAAAAAEVWVRVDTAYGNDDSHFITMYWGNPSAAGASSGAAVFDTGYGNLGVWHLGAGLADATVNGDNGIDSSTGDAAGIIGRCRHFDPALRSFIGIPNESRFELTANFTLSAWVLVDSFAELWQTVVAKGDNSYRLHCDTSSKVGVFSLTDADTVDFGYQDDRGQTAVNDHQWHLLTGVYDGSVMKMYTDGILEGQRTVNMPCLTGASNLTIGDNRPRSPRFFAGSIDEVRVMNAAMSDDWVKLCYMNQKEKDALIVFK
jgi:Concanavalin A-like lectin/glucanases superfamily/Domain of unknown function (DUF2341)